MWSFATPFTEWPPITERFAMRTKPPPRTAVACWRSCQPGTDWSKLSRQRRSISSMIWNWRGRSERMSDTGHFSSASGMTVWFV